MQAWAQEARGSRQLPLEGGQAGSRQIRKRADTGCRAVEVLLQLLE